MGPDASVTNKSYSRVFDTVPYMPSVVERRKPERKLRSIVESVPQSAPLLTTQYQGVWSMDYSDSLPPLARLGQTHVYDKEKDRLIIAYGCDANGRLLNDAWALDFKTNRWYPLANSLLSPRTDVSSCLINRMMFMFGGFDGTNYLADLHALNIDTGAVSTIGSSINAPPPRANPVLFHREGKLILWGGHDDETRNGTHVYDFDSRKWELIESSHTGRSAPAYCLHNGEIYAFGSSKGHGLIKFENSFQMIECTGTEPSSELMNAALVSADEYLFLIGGKADSQFMHVFALDIKRHWWFAFHVRPDMETLSLSDGIVNKIGLFMLPREHSASVIYREKSRELVSIMGSRMSDPPPIYRIAIGNALASLHLRSDMLNMIQPH